MKWKDVVLAASASKLLASRCLHSLEFIIEHKTFVTNKATESGGWSSAQT